ncbi:unnamed protein product, partial [Coccothraustes coccothraustes]
AGAAPGGERSLNFPLRKVGLQRTRSRVTRSGQRAAGPSRAPRSRRRSPSAGCRRASLALGPRRGRRAPARAEAMPDHSP